MSVIGAVRTKLGALCATALVDEEDNAVATVYDYMPENPTLPCVVVPWPDEVTYVTKMRTLSCDMTFTVMVAVPDTDFRNAQIKMDMILSPSLDDPNIPIMFVQPGNWSTSPQPWKSAQLERVDNIRREQAQNNQTYLIADLTINVTT
jgi:hypothetical protein